MDALQGLKVVDLSPSRVGAQVSQLFADFGADVVWVEPPGGADLRSQASFPFLCRGKRSLVVDLQDPAGVEQLRRVIDGADVVIESFRPGVTERLGLGYHALAESNPGLVYASISGWGRTGRLAGAPGYEGLVMAKVGLFAAFGSMHDDERPPYVSAPWCTFPASQLALQGVLAALVERERSGRGQWVETSLVQGFAALDTWSWFVHLINERYPDAYPAAAMYDDDGSPASAFAFMLLVALTKDGRWLQFAQVAPRLLLALMRALGLEALLADPAMQGDPVHNTPQRRLEIWNAMLEAAGTKTLAEWQAIFDADPDVFAELFRRGPEVLDHPQMVAAGEVVEVEDPSLGTVRQPGALVHLSATPARVERRAPSLGDAAAGDIAWPAAGSDGAGAPSAPAGLPLEGVTVLELAVLFAGPYGATLLTDLGARVIKVEPLTGDPIRGMIGFPEAAGAKAMQGKDSICIDITTAEGLALVHRLAARVDVVLQGYRAGVAERHQIDAETLRGINPDLIYLHSSGYGPNPPDGHRPAFAPSMAAAGGIARTNIGESVPERAGLSPEEIRNSARNLSGGGTVMGAQADGFAAVGVGSSLLLGLLARLRGAGAQTMTGSMLATVAHAMADQVVDYPGVVHPRPADADLRGAGARYRVYDASDGWVFLAAPQEREWAALAASLLPDADLAGDARFATEAARAANDDALVEVLAETFVKRGKDDWERDLLAAGVGCVAVSTEPIESVLQGEDFGYGTGLIVDVDHPTFDRHPRLAPLVGFSRSRTQAKPGVLAGSATDAVLAELGLTGAEIADLRARNVVG